jgi:anhydro-N-acetylmuramic acid kinase
MTAEYTAIGIMSGSSLDGVDIAYCRFYHNNERWRFEITAATTAELGEWKDKLKNARQIDALTLCQYDADFGIFLGKLCKKFISDNGLEKPDLIASHGHTVFHFPEKGFTCQIGNGAHIAAINQCTTVSRLRDGDIACGGNGAPIVPIGDKMLFDAFDFCLNLGGIANITFQSESFMEAFDICVANQILNHYAAQIGFEYDPDGENAAKGKINETLLKQLSEVAFYQKTGPKSLDNAFSNEIISIIDSFEKNTHDKLRTYTEHIALMVSNEILKRKSQNASVLISGGGAFNTFLVSRIKNYLDCSEIIIPDSDIIHYKEALIMAFIGVLRIRNEVNCLAAVTGASRNNISGVVHGF